MGLTQQMNSFRSLGSFSRSLAATPSTPIVTVTTPERATMTIAGSPQMNPFTRCSRSQHEFGDEDMGEACASGLHNVNIDRVKSVRADDNQENCIKLCNDLLTRGVATSPSSEARRCSIGRNFSPLATSDHASNRSTSGHFSPSPSSFCPQQASPPTRDLGAGDVSQHQQQFMSQQMSQSLSLPQAGNQTTATTASTTFPPTPPSDDMMLENN